MPATFAVSGRKTLSATYPSDSRKTLVSVSIIRCRKTLEIFYTFDMFVSDVVGGIDTVDTRSVVVGSGVDLPLTTMCHAWNRFAIRRMHSLGWIYILATQKCLGEI